MATLRNWLIEAAGGEEIEAVVLGEMGWGDYGSDDVPNYAACPKNTVLTWDEAQPWIGYEFDSGFGAPGCQAVYAWTATRVLFVSQYDGATAPNWIPRHPQNCEPRMPGG